MLRKPQLRPLRARSTHNRAAGVIETIAAHLVAAGEAPRLLRRPLGAPGPGEVLVRMLRSPINQADLLTLDGRYTLAATFPQFLGAEGVGEVVDVGAHVAGLAAGDRVLPLERGNWATHRLVRADAVVRLSGQLPLDVAAVLRINPATAWRMLASAERGGTLRPGDWIVQNGGRSHVAEWVRRIARRRGYRVISVVRPGGATGKAMVEDSSDLAAKVERVVGVGRVALALDCVAGEATGRLARLLSSDGQVIVFGRLSGEPCSIDSRLLTGGALTVRGFSLRPDEQGDTLETLASLYSELAETAVASPAPAITATFSLAEIDEAIACARLGTGRVLLALDV